MGIIEGAKKTFIGAFCILEKNAEYKYDAEAETIEDVKTDSVKFKHKRYIPHDIPPPIPPVSILDFFAFRANAKPIEPINAKIT